MLHGEVVMASTLALMKTLLPLGIGGQALPGFLFSFTVLPSRFLLAGLLVLMQHLHQLIPVIHLASQLDPAHQGG